MKIPEITFREVLASQIYQICVYARALGETPQEFETIEKLAYDYVFKSTNARGINAHYEVIGQMIYATNNNIEHKLNTIRKHRDDSNITNDIRPN